MLPPRNQRMPGRTLDGVSRRDFLADRGWASGGLTLADLLRLKAARGSPLRGEPEGGHHGLPSRWAQSHRDVRPKARRAGRVPRRIRPIRTNVPGMDVCELMPLQAKIADRSPSCGASRRRAITTDELLTGTPAAASGQIGSNRRPALGCVVSKLQSTDGPVPPYVSVSSHGSSAVTMTPRGPAYLGAAHRPSSARAGHEFPDTDSRNHP